MNGELLADAMSLVNTTLSSVHSEIQHSNNIDDDDNDDENLEARSIARGLIESLDEQCLSSAAISAYKKLDNARLSRELDNFESLHQRASVTGRTEILERQQQQAQATTSKLHTANQISSAQITSHKNESHRAQNNKIQATNDSDIASMSSASFSINSNNKRQSYTLNSDIVVVAAAAANQQLQRQQYQRPTSVDATQANVMNVAGDITDDNYESANESHSAAVGSAAAASSAADDSVHRGANQGQARTPRRPPRVLPQQQAGMTIAVRSFAAASGAPTSSEIPTRASAAAVRHSANRRASMADAPVASQSSGSSSSGSGSAKVNNGLARGKQQRASISSCSSSDSYASYGSGYASGSGNSTDHEHRLQQLRNQPAATAAAAASASAAGPSEPAQSASASSPTTGSATHNNTQQQTAAAAQDHHQQQSSQALDNGQRDSSAIATAANDEPERNHRRVATRITPPREQQQQNNCDSPNRQPAARTSPPKFQYQTPRSIMTSIGCAGDSLVTKTATRKATRASPDAEVSDGNEVPNTDDDDDDEVDIGDEEEDEDSQLKQHLSELEQLTDELARSNIFKASDAAIMKGKRQQQQQQVNRANDERVESNGAVSNHHHRLMHQFTSTIKSTSSNASSILSSTDSNLSSLSSNVACGDGIVGTKLSAQCGQVDQQQQQHRSGQSFNGHAVTGPAPQRSRKNENNHDDEEGVQDSLNRSASATPTSQLITTTTTTTKATFAPSAADKAANQVDHATPPSSSSSRQQQLTSSQHHDAVAHTSPPSKSTLSQTNSLFASNGVYKQLQQGQQSAAREQKTLTSSEQPTAPNGNNAPTNNSAAAAASSSSSKQQEPYYHNLFQWEQLVSKGVTRPLLINDLDFTDLRDEDDCDLLNSNANGDASRRAASNCATMPLSISVNNNNNNNSNYARGQDSVDSGTNSAGANNAPPPMPPPPMSPWMQTLNTSRPQSQFLSSPSPTTMGGATGVDTEPPPPSSPAASVYSNLSGSRNSVCILQTSTPTQGQQSALNQTVGTLHSAGANQSPFQFNTLQPVTSLRSASSMSSLLFGGGGPGSRYAANKRKKTMKLFWKEVREDRSLLAKLTKKRTIWDEIKPVDVDTQRLEYLFESKAKDLLLAKSRNGLDGANQRKVKITVLDAKRSNAINIGMTKLPPMRTIKSAILRMDSSIMNREGIEKILTTMMPTEEEKSRIIEAQLANPDTPLGTAEQFLLNLASISALEARLKLWAFQLDYAQIEKEVAEPLMDLKQAINEIEKSDTFRIILGTLLAIGNFLNSTSVKGFQIDYLEKVPEVKDTVHKHSLLHHLCLFIQEKYGQQATTDLYSEFSAVNRASKIDYVEVAKNLKKMQQDCKASWDYLKIVAKHDGLANLMNASSSSGGSSSVVAHDTNNSSSQQQHKPAGKLNNLSKLSMITSTVIGGDGGSTSPSSASSASSSSPSTVNGNSNAEQGNNSKQLKTKVSDFLTDCAERIMVLMVVHRRVMNRFQKLLVYLGCPSQQIKQTQPHQILKIINEFALEYRTKRERVREMLVKRQQQQQQQQMCSRHHNLFAGPGAPRWRLANGAAGGRPRWAGSQQCINTLSSAYNGRPCSTTSSCASSVYACGCMNDSLCNLSTAGADDSLVLGNNKSNMSASSGHARPGSPSSYSQMSNEFAYDQSYQQQQQQSTTPVPSSQQRRGSAPYSQQQQQQRAHSMLSVSMLDLQEQQPTPEQLSVEERQQALKKDEQLRRLLGAGKSLDGACSELYQMSHWSSTMTRVTRPSQMRANSIDSNGGGELGPDGQSPKQSSYYRYLSSQGRLQMRDDDDEPNSDEEILQSLVRTATARGPSNHQHHHNNSHGNNHQQRHYEPAGLASGNSGGGQKERSPNGSSPSNKSARNKILSRFNCDRKSFRRTLRDSIELSNVS